MYRFVIMLIFCLAAHSTSGKSVSEINANPEYDLIAEESRSFSSFWPEPEFDSSSQDRFKHYARGVPPGWGNGRPEFGVPPRHQFHHPHPHPHHFLQSSEEYGDGDNFYNFPQHHQHHHGFPPGHGKKHGHHGHLGHPHDYPRRFPPPPVYNEDFIPNYFFNSTRRPPFTVQQPMVTTTSVYIAPFTVQKPIATTPAVYIAPKLTTTTTTTTPPVYIAPKLTTTTTPAPISTTTSKDQLTYDIDVRFGRD